MPITTMKCGKCGGEMSLNPHPAAGNPDLYIEVGCQFECIPCLVKSRHEWAVRASKAEKDLEAIRTNQCSMCTLWQKMKTEVKAND